MMKRMVAGVIVVCSVALFGGVAAAQSDDYPTPTPAPAPESCATVGISASGPLLPNATVDVTLTCSTMEAGRSYSGTLQSTPVALPPTVAQVAGSVTFVDVTLPADWAVNAQHTATLVDVASGQALGSTTFYVDSAGAITAPPAQPAPGTGGLPLTGSDAGSVLKVGAALVALGAGAVLVARRRRGALTAA